MPVINGSGFPVAGGGGGSQLPVQTLGLFGLNAGPVTVTSGATNVKGSWTALGTLTQAIDRLGFDVFGTYANSPMLIDIDVGGVQVISDFPYIGANQGGGRINLPIHIPAGAVRIRTAAVSNVQSLDFFPRAWAFDVAETATLVEPIGAVGVPATTGITYPSVGNIPTTGAAWQQINAVGIANAIRGFVPFVGMAGDYSRNLARYTVEFATGEPGSEVALPIMFVVGGGTSQIIGEWNLDPVMQAFPAGTKFSARVNASVVAIANPPDLLNIQIHGIR